jgi:hypothetical protein
LRVLKSNILSRIQELDDKADGQGLDEEGWGLRYYLEDQLLEILSGEEEYWRQRGRLQWTLQGDANTKFFHACANGRKRRCAILSLASDNGAVVDKDEIRELIYSFYINLMGSEEPRVLRLQEGTWTQE